MNEPLQMTPQGQTIDRKFDTITQRYTRSGYIDVVDRCNAIILTCVGDTQVRVDEIVLNPSVTPATVLGDSFVIGGNENEIYAKKVLQLTFVVPVGAAPQLQVVQKFYTT